MVLARWARWLTLFLAAVAVFYCVAWFLLGMVFALTGTAMGILIYVVGFGVMLTPMVAYGLAGSILHAERPVRRAALWGIAALLPVGVLSLSFATSYLRMAPQWTAMDAVAFACCAIPGGVCVAAAMIFAALAFQKSQITP